MYNVLSSVKTLDAKTALYAEHLITIGPSLRPLALDGVVHTSQDLTTLKNAFTGKRVYWFGRQRRPSYLLLFASLVAVAFSSSSLSRRRHRD